MEREPASLAEGVGTLIVSERGDLLPLAYGLASDWVLSGCDPDTVDAPLRARVDGGGP